MNFTIYRVELSTTDRIIFSFFILNLDPPTCEQEILPFPIIMMVTLSSMVNIEGLFTYRLCC